MPAFPSEPAKLVTIKETLRSKESIFGSIASEEECLQIIDMCRSNVLPRVTSRLTDDERDQIRPGSVFVYEEEESGISRWTDGRTWSSSKIHGQCLVYYELTHRGLSGDTGSSGSGSMSVEEIIALGREAIQTEGHEKRALPVKVPSGLIKMTTSLAYQSKVYHLISYTTSTFMKENKRAGIWHVVKTWEIPRNFHLRMNYRKKRASLSEIDKIPVSLLGKKPEKQKRAYSCPILSDISISTPQTPPRWEHSEDFFMEYLYRSDLYMI